MNVKVVYDNIRDRELLNLVDSKFPIFIEYIDANTKEGKKEAFRVKSHWAARANPFIEITEEDKIIKVFYSDAKGDNAIYQLINFLNESKI